MDERYEILHGYISENYILNHYIRFVGFGRGNRCPFNIPLILKSFIILWIIPTDTNHIIKKLKSIMVNQNKHALAINCLLKRVLIYRKTFMRTKGYVHFVKMRPSKNSQLVIKPIRSISPNNPFMDNKSWSQLFKIFELFSDFSEVTSKDTEVVTGLMPYQKKLMSGNIVVQRRKQDERMSRLGYCDQFTQTLFKLIILQLMNWKCIYSAFDWVVNEKSIIKYRKDIIQMNRLFESKVENKILDSLSHQ